MKAITNCTTVVLIQYMNDGLSMHITSNDLEMYALAKRLDELATDVKEITSGDQRTIVSIIERCIQEMVVRE